jgi:predicted metal-dependent peptidase
MTLHPGLDKVIKARGSLLLEKPWYASTCLRLRIELFPEEAWDLPWLTMGTDGEKLIVNPKWVDKLTLDETKGVLIHEVWHVWGKHHLRLGDRHVHKANCAMDYAINPLIKSDGVSLPGNALKVNDKGEGHLDDPQFHGMFWEQIYDRLPDPPEGEGQCDGNCQPGDGSEGEGSGVCNCPGCHKLPDGREFSDPSKTGGVIRNPAQGMERKELERKVDQWVQQAANIAKQAGNVPAGLARLVDDLMNPVLPWKELLARFITEKSKNDFTWRIPSKKYIQHGFYMPSLQSEEIGTIAILVDTSGSISQVELNEFASELQGIMIAYPGVTLQIVYVDAAVAGHEIITGQDPLVLTPAGGGGTDFRPGFDWLEENEIEPVAAVYYTDGWCHSFPEVPEFPVLWVLSTERRQDFEAPFGEVCQIVR